MGITEYNYIHQVTMKSFATAAIVAVAASTTCQGFSPTTAGRSSSASSTTLNSHFSSIETQLFNKQTLLKALNDMGIKSTSLKADGELSRHADIKVKRSWRISLSPSKMNT